MSQDNPVKTEEQIKIEHLENLLSDAYWAILHLTQADQADEQIPHHVPTPNSLISHIHYYFNKYQGKQHFQILYRSKEHKVEEDRIGEEATKKAWAKDRERYPEAYEDDRA